MAKGRKPSRLISADDSVAQYPRLSRQVLDRTIRRGQLPFFRVGTSVYFERVDVEALAQRQRVVVN